MIVTKGASGFGDTIYMRVVMEWLVKNCHDRLAIMARYPEVFTGLPVETWDFYRKENIDHFCTYITAKKSEYTQFQDLLMRGHLPNIEFTSDLKNRKPSGKVLVIPTYAPMNGVSNAVDMKPMQFEFSKFVTKFHNVEYLEGKYEFLELVDIFNSASLVIGQVGWIAPMAQMLDVPLILIFTKRAMNSQNRFLRDILPHKIIEKPTTHAVIME